MLVETYYASLEIKEATRPKNREEGVGTDLLGVSVEGGSDGNDDALARAEPERPLAGERFRQNGDHALHRAQHRPMDNHRLRLTIHKPTKKRIQHTSSRTDATKSNCRCC